MQEPYRTQRRNCKCSLKIQQEDSVRGITFSHSWKIRRDRLSDRGGGIILRAESLSIFLDKSGRVNKTLPAASTFRIERALTIQKYSGVRHA